MVSTLAFLAGQFDLQVLGAGKRSEGTRVCGVVWGTYGVKEVIAVLWSEFYHGKKNG
jgi:hypothetical protein